jgi:hypothetical protein
MKGSAPLDGRPLALGTTRVDSDGPIAIAHFGPLAAEAAVAVERQAELTAPAKLALTPQGACELFAEVLCTNGSDAPKLARDALDHGRAWLAGQSPRGETAGADADDLVTALAELPRTWVWEPGDADEFRLHATAFGESVRLTIRPAARGAQVIARSSVAAPDATVARALSRFALETNRRLRLARIGVSGPERDACAVSWDSVTPPGVDLAGVVPAAVEAVVRAHAATRRSMRALGHPQIAQSYLEARDPAPKRRRRASRG